MGVEQIERNELAELSLESRIVVSVERLVQGEGPCLKAKEDKSSQNGRLIHRLAFHSWAPSEVRYFLIQNCVRYIRFSVAIETGCGHIRIPCLGVAVSS